MAPLHLCLNSYIHMTVRVIVNVHEDSGIFSFVTCYTCTFPPSSTQAQTRDLLWPPTREQSDTCPSWVAASTASAGHYRGPARCSGNRGSSHCRAPPSSGVPDGPARSSAPSQPATDVQHKQEISLRDYQPLRFEGGLFPQHSLS